MKSKHILMAAVLLWLPAAAPAQKTIRKAVDDFVEKVQKLSSNNSKATIAIEKSIQTNEKTGKKESLMELYTVSLPSDYASYFTILRKAFDKDSSTAYTIKAGTSDGRPYTYVSLAVGDGSGVGIPIGKIPDSQYIYSLYLDPEDGEKNHRYAYALEWKESKTKTDLRVIVTYATTADYRTKTKQLKQIIQSSIGKSFYTISKEKKSNEEAIDWLGEFSMLIQKYKWYEDSGLYNSSVVIAEIYKLCQDTRSQYLADDDKQVVREELEELQKKAPDRITLKMIEKSKGLIK